MKIAILVPNFVGFDGGAQEARLQAEKLAGEGHYVAIFTFIADIKPENIDLFIIGAPGNSFCERIYRLLFPLDIIKLIRWLPKLRSFDQIIVHLYPLTWLGYLAKKLYKVRYIFRYHGIMDPKFLPRLYERLYLRLQIFLTRLTIKNADDIFSVSEFARDELKRYTGTDSQVMYDTINTRLFHHRVNGGTEIRQRYQIGGAPVILFVGTLRPTKGVHLLIQSFKLIRQKIPESRLIIVGKDTFGYYTRQLKQMSDDSIIFTGFVPHEALPPYYAMCDIYATCSLWETFNLPLVEAQACNKPVVAFNIGPHAEVIDGNNILVEANNIEAFAEACITRLKEVRVRVGDDKTLSYS